jgi:tRNA G18 (ribose-2'-O)-methylase SpoU
MSEAAFDSLGDESIPASLFYRCDNVNSCGMRFPVTTTEPFRGRCPRCGGTVQVVASVGDDDLSAHDVATSVTLPSSSIYLLLDNWRSLFNVGAAFRSADGAGVRHLYLCGITATPENQHKLAKTALGAERAVAWSYHPDAVKLATRLQREGALLWVLERGSAAHSLFDITAVADNHPLVLIAGNEVAGVDPELVAMADRVIQLPMLGSKRSLNVAVALSIATYWLRARQVVASAELCSR